MFKTIVNRLLLAAAGLGLFAAVPALRDASDTGSITAEGWATLVGYIAAALWRMLPDTDHDGLPNLVDPDPTRPVE